jgi:hypothetical protein
MMMEWEWRVEEMLEEDLHGGASEGDELAANLQIK